MRYTIREVQTVELIESLPVYLIRRLREWWKVVRQ